MAVKVKKSTATKKKSVKQEPLLTAVARRLGQAAGTVTNLTHGILAHGLLIDGGSESPSALLAVETRVREAAIVGKAAKPAADRSGHHPKKRTLHAVGTAKKAKSVGAKRTRSRR